MPESGHTATMRTGSGRSAKLNGQLRRVKKWFYGLKEKIFIIFCRVLLSLNGQEIAVPKARRRIECDPCILLAGARFITRRSTVIIHPIRRMYNKVFSCQCRRACILPHWTLSCLLKCNWSISWSRFCWRRPLWRECNFFQMTRGVCIHRILVIIRTLAAKFFVFFSSSYLWTERSAITRTL